jgi:uncharacterized protein
MILPKPTPDDAFFWEGAAAGKLLVRACRSCGRIQHPPSPMCPACASTSWDHRELAGRGTVHSWIASHHPGRPDEEPRVVILVELDEGVRMVSNLVGVALDDVRNEMPVQVCFAETEGIVLPQFEAAGDRAGELSR